jgi:DNA replication protein DnaC
MYRGNFGLYEEDYDVIYKLLIYFLGHEQEAHRLGIDLNKGLHVTGPIGCGKTSLLNIMRYVPKPERFYNIKPCRDISFEFIQDGYEVIDRYTRMSYTSSNPKVYCFDDLGSENNIRYYGNTCNVLGEILTSRYDLFVSHGMMTHITTNLSASELETYYGNRLRSRQRAMFNLVAFSGSSKDKRQ